MSCDVYEDFVLLKFKDQIKRDEVFKKKDHLIGTSIYFDYDMTRDEREEQVGLRKWKEELVKKGIYCEVIKGFLKYIGKCFRLVERSEVEKYIKNDLMRISREQRVEQCEKNLIKNEDKNI